MSSTTRPSSAAPSLSPPLPPGSMMVVGTKYKSSSHFMFLSDYIIANSHSFSRLAVPIERYRPLITPSILINSSHATTMLEQQRPARGRPSFFPFPSEQGVLDDNRCYQSSRYHPTLLLSEDFMIVAPRPPPRPLPVAEQAKNNVGVPASAPAQEARMDDESPRHLTSQGHLAAVHLPSLSSEYDIRTGQFNGSNCSGCPSKVGDAILSRPTTTTNKKKAQSTPAHDDVSNGRKVMTEETTIVSMSSTTTNSSNESSTRFRTYQSGNWMERYAELVEFKRYHGHCLVPNSYKENPPLAEWVKRQRYQYKLKNLGQHNSMTQDRIQILEKLGFAWNSHDQLWEERLNDLKLYLEINGDCNVPNKYPPDPSLAVWVKRQRRHYKLLLEGKDSSLTPYRVKKLTDIGFIGKDASTSQLRTRRS